MFGTAFLPRSASSAGPDLKVLSHNVYAANPDPAATARQLHDAKADVIAVQELTSSVGEELHAVLDDDYPFQATAGTVTAWSRYPVRDTTPVDVGLGWVRALRTTVETPNGDVELYVVHLASIRFGADGLASQRRDATLSALTEAIADDPADRLILAGDLNTATTDRSFGGLSAHLTEVQRSGGTGFGFTWPSSLPMVRLDHMLSRGLTVTDSTVLDATGSDHRPIMASFAIR